MPIYKWICPSCRGAYILPRRSKHQHNNWRCYSCGKVFHAPLEVGSMGWDASFDQPLTRVRRPENWASIVGSYSGPYKFPAQMMMYPEKPLAAASGGQPKGKRKRATLVAEHYGEVLLVQERGAHRYSLPGGGLERGESVLQAAIRELKEETKLEVVKAEYLFDYEGSTQLHKVVWAAVCGQVQVQSKEISGHKWWNATEDVLLLDSTAAILRRFRNLHGD